jgi:broad specificity phosphatase PhoE
LGPGSHQETGFWNLKLKDITRIGNSRIKKAAKILGKLLNRDSDIAIVLTSPRARTIASSKEIIKEIKKNKIEIVKSQDINPALHICQILRSGGDFSPLFDEESDSNKPDLEKFKDLTKAQYKDRINMSTGLRFKEFLNFVIRHYKGSFPSAKTPTFITVTHNEVASVFLDKLKVIPGYKEEEGIIPAGAFFKIEVDTSKPNELKVSFPDPTWHFKSTTVSSVN